MFSAVIPLYNKRPFIRRALDSIAAQEFRCTEVIVVNDGSTDGGDEIARAWSDPRLKVIDQPNSGVSVACNTGLASANNALVAFLDADDEWSPGFLRRMHELTAQHPDAVLYGSGYVAHANNDQQRQYGASGPTAIGGVTDFFHEISRGHVIHRSSTVVSRAAALAVGGFPKGVQCFEDYIFWIKLALIGEFVLTPEPLVRYDMAVPGQLLAAWRQTHECTFAATDLDIFLANELRRRAGSTQTTPAVASFTSYAHRHLAAEVLKRAYWGHFDSVNQICRDLRLDDVPLGWLVVATAWAARHPATHLFLRAALAVIRPARQAMLRILRPRR